jgi:hypothetical protein
VSVMRCAAELPGLRRRSDDDSNDVLCIDAHC